MGNLEDVMDKCGILAIILNSAHLISDEQLAILRDELNYLLEVRKKESDELSKKDNVLPLNRDK